MKQRRRPSSPIIRKNTQQRFANPAVAGSELAGRLDRFASNPEVIVLALPNGGVPVAAEIAGRLHKPFDVLLIEEITTPGHNGKSLGAITCGGVRRLNSAMIDRLHLSQSEINTAVLEGSRKLARHEKLCRGHSAPLEIADHTVILVDDGTTPCAVVRDAIRLLRRQHADHVIVALPSACRHDACDLRMEADDVVTLEESTISRISGKRQSRFPATTTAEVRRLLSSANRSGKRLHSIA